MKCLILKFRQNYKWPKISVIGFIPLNIKMTWPFIILSTHTHTIVYNVLFFALFSPFLLWNWNVQRIEAFEPFWSNFFVIFFVCSVASFFVVWLYPTQFLPVRFQIIRMRYYCINDSSTVDSFFSFLSHFTFSFCSMW